MAAPEKFSESVKLALIAAKKAALAIGKEGGSEGGVAVEGWELLNGLYQVEPGLVGEFLGPRLASRKILLKDVPWVDLQKIPESSLEGKRFVVVNPPGENYINRALKKAGNTPLEPKHLIEVLLTEPDSSLASVLKGPSYFEEMGGFLKSRIIGQDACIDALIRGIKVSRMRLSAEKPFSLALLGPTGVGKTELVKQTAGFMFGEADAKARLLCLNFSRYQMETAYEMIFGGSPWKGQPPEGLLFPFLQPLSRKVAGSSMDFEVEKPCIILLDEIEKAHYSLCAALLELLDTGVVEVIHKNDHHRFQLSSNTLVFMTSNAGSALYDDPSIGTRFIQNQQLIKEALQKEAGSPADNVVQEGLTQLNLRAGFRPEFLGRIDSFIMFSRLQPSHMEQIAELNLHGLESRIRASGLFPDLNSMNFDPALKTLLAFKDGFNYGVRNLRSLIEDSFVPPLITHLDRKSGTGIKEISFRLEDDLFKKRMCESSKTIRVLAIDDPEDLRDPEDYRNHFKELSFNWDSASTVEEALDLLKRNEYLFVLMDLLEDVLAQIRRRYPHLPVFIFSDEAPVENVNRVLQAGGALDFLRKDLDEVEIQRQLASFRLLALDQQRISAMKDYLAGQANGFSFEMGEIQRDSSTLKLAVKNVQPSYTPRTDDLGLYAHKKAAVSLKDVQGLEGVREQVEELLAILKTPQKYLALGAYLPKGILLYGPPGTGKTMLSNALAYETGLPFLHTSSAVLLSRYQRYGGPAVSAFFNQARRNSPCVVFIDEIDGVGHARGGGMESSLLHALMAGIDEIKRHELILFIAATNCPEVLDPALVRPGRFDRKLRMEPPNRVGRKAILEKLIRNYDTSGLDIEKTAGLSFGFTGAMLVALLNEAALAARRKGASSITQDVLEEVIDQVRYGPEVPVSIKTEDRLKVAVHELGHAIVTVELGHERLHRVTVISRQDYLGMSGVLPEEEPCGRHRGYWIGKIAVCLAGRAAEMMVHGEEAGLDPGAESDLLKATDIARSMVCRWGMGSSLRGCLLDVKENYLGVESADQRFFSEATAQAIDKAVQDILEEADQKAYAIIEKWKTKMKLLARTLLEEEEFSGERLIALMREHSE